MAISGDERTWADLSCLVAHDASGCEEGLRADPSASRRRFLGSVGCLDMKVGSVCTQYGDDLARVKDPTVMSMYQKACEYGHGLGCLRVLTLNRQMAENLSADKLQALSIQMKPVAVRACDLDKKTPATCVQAEQVLAELGKNQNSAFGPCKLKYIWIQRRNYGPVHGEKADGAGLRNLGTREQCISRCATWLNDMAMPEDSLGHLRAICEFSGKDIPPAHWHKNRPHFCAERQSLRVGNGGDQLFLRCYCETAPHEEAQAVAEKFGIFGFGVAAYSKTFGRTKWSRCGLRFFYDDEAAARQNLANCKENLNSFLNEMKHIPTDKTIDYDYGNLKCETK